MTEVYGEVVSRFRDVASKAHEKTLITHESHDLNIAAFVYEPSIAFIEAFIDNEVNNLAHAHAWQIGPDIYLADIYVKESWRRLGLGSLLLSVFRDSISLDVRKDNAAAINLYRKLGLKERGIKPGYYNDGEDSVYMEGTVRPVQLPYYREKLQDRMSQLRSPERLQ